MVDKALAAAVLDEARVNAIAAACAAPELQEAVAPYLEGDINAEAVLAFLSDPNGGARGAVDLTPADLFAALYADEGWPVLCAAAYRARTGVAGGAFEIACDTLLRLAQGSAAIPTGNPGVNARFAADLALLVQVKCIAQSTLDALAERMLGPVSQLKAHGLEGLSAETLKEALEVKRG